MPDPLMLTLTPKDLTTFLDTARLYWAETPAESCLPGSETPMNARQFTAVAHLQAALDLFYRLGLMSNTQIRLDIGSSEPDTEDI